MFALILFSHIFWASSATRSWSMVHFHRERSKSGEGCKCQGRDVLKEWRNFQGRNVTFKYGRIVNKKGDVSFKGEMQVLREKSKLWGRDVSFKGEMQVFSKGQKSKGR